MSLVEFAASIPSIPSMFVMGPLRCFRRRRMNTAAPTTAINRTPDPAAMPISIILLSIPVAGFLTSLSPAPPVFDGGGSEVAVSLSDLASVAEADDDVVGSAASDEELVDDSG